MTGLITLSTHSGRGNDFTRLDSVPILVAPASYMIFLEAKLPQNFFEDVYCVLDCVKVPSMRTGTQTQYEITITFCMDFEDIPLSLKDSVERSRPTASIVVTIPDDHINQDHMRPFQFSVADAFADFAIERQIVAMLANYYCLVIEPDGSTDPLDPAYFRNIQKFTLMPMSELDYDPMSADEQMRFLQALDIEASAVEADIPERPTYLVFCTKNLHETQVVNRGNTYYGDKYVGDAYMLTLHFVDSAIRMYK